MNLNTKDIPDDVWWVYIIQSTHTAIDSYMYDKIDKIIKENPKYFPWEHKYASIPKEIHNAYSKEKHSNKFKSINIPSGEGLIAEINKSKIYNYPKNKSFKELFKELNQYEAEQRQKEKDKYKKDKNLWDKHYKKYNLEYRK